MSEATRRFLEILRGQQQAATMPQASIMRQYQTPQGIVPPMALRRPAPPSAMPTAMPTAPKLSPMMQEIAKRAAARRSMTSGTGAGMPTGAMPQPSAPTMPQGGGAPAATTFGQRFAQPQTQALLGAAIEGAKASGYQDRPVSLGQVLGRMGAGAMSGYQAAEDRQTKLAASLAAAQRQKRLDEAKAAYDAEMLELKRREVEGASGKTQRAITKEQFDMEDKLFNKYESVSSENREAFFGYQKVRNAAQAYKDAAARGEEPSGASDIALLIGYMKTLDPGSVVRETEYATAKNAGGVSERVRNIFHNVRDAIFTELR